MIAVAIFFILHFLLFIPRYIFNKETASFFGLNEIFPNGKFYPRALLSRFNDDFFRINIEFTVLILAVILGEKFISVFYAQIVTALFYILTLVLFYYHYSIYSIYKTYPAISVDKRLIFQGLSIAYNGFKVAFFLGIVAFLGLIGLVCFLNNYLVLIIYKSNSNLLFLTCIVTLTAFLFFAFIKKINPFRFTKEVDFHYLIYSSFQSSVFILNSNSFFNKKAQAEIDAIPGLLEQNKIEIPDTLLLTQKPNIYFIAIESYGAIVYENEIYHEKYKVLSNIIYKNLKEKDWHIASSMSAAPVSGGGSWMSYSSFLKGVNIKSDSLYKYLLNQQDKFPIQSLFTILEKWGYHNYLVAAIGGFENFKIDWEETVTFLGTKNLIRFKDLEYSGERFNFGPSAPDQYMLNKAIQLMKEKHKHEPISFFTETNNSHYKFYSPTKILSKWESCNEATLKEFCPTTNLEKNKAENYFTAIEYQLKTIEDLIVNENEDSIFILFGDHQPPVITNHKNSFKTPIHVVSKNKTFVENWYKSGFFDALFLENQNDLTGLNHFDFKKLFIKNFLVNYEKNK